jgi:hypothetical protein
VKKEEAGAMSGCWCSGIATSDVVYEIAREKLMQKKQVSSKKKKSVGRGSNTAHFTYNMRHVHHMHRTTAYLVLEHRTRPAHRTNPANPTTGAFPQLGWSVAPSVRP